MKISRRTRAILLGIGLGFLFAVVLGFLSAKRGDDDAENVSRFTLRHLMANADGSSSNADIEDSMPVPELEFWISGDTAPNNIDGGSVLVYNWQLMHRVEPEHTAINVSFEVDFPFLSFHRDSVNITLQSWSFAMNETDIKPTDVTWLEQENKVQLLVGIAEPLWINLTKPEQRSDCWWTPGIQCYKTTYEDCVFYDTSEEQNWDPTFCNHFNISQCLPHNTTSECFFVNPSECLSRLHTASEDSSTELLCPVQSNTTCVQINDRGLLFAQYDWTIPTKAPVLESYNKEICGMSTAEVWTYEENRNGTMYIVDIILAEDLERNCRTVWMKLKPVPQTEAPTYNPYKELPTTTDYVDAKYCINVNTTGFYYPPPTPIDWQDFRLSVFMTGELTNFVEVNQLFAPVLTSNITQPTRPPSERVTTATASLEYTVKRPSLHLNPIPSFSEKPHALKHEQIFYHLVLRHPEVMNRGIEVRVSFPVVDGEPSMTFLNETPQWQVGANLVATTQDTMFNKTMDRCGRLISMETIEQVIANSDAPSIRSSFVSMDQNPNNIDQMIVNINPFVNLQDQKDNADDKITISFYSRVLTTVLPGLQIPLEAKAFYKFSRNDFKSSHTPKLTIIDQPFIPRIPPADLTQTPDTADLIQFIFDLSHVLDFSVYDIWMNVSCPDLHIVTETLDIKFFDPDANLTANTSSPADDGSSVGSTDARFTTETTYHIHMPSLAPRIHLVGNQTFLLWNNSMLTHQDIVCTAMLSYRKETQALILPYVAGESPALKLPGIHSELYPKNLLGLNDTMYRMPVGSNATYILNITFPEVSTKLDITLQMPHPVLAVYYAHVIHQGSRLTLDSQGVVSVDTPSLHIDNWDIPARTIVHLDFGMVKNLADNKLDSAGDNLIVEFNVVLENSTKVVRDTKHTLTTTVSYSNGEDLVQDQTIHVLEPEVALKLNLTNETNAGDPGDVFQYHVLLSHTDASQSPAHHIAMEIHLPYMQVYQDFIPSNASNTPITKIHEGLGKFKADGMLWLYLYKLPVGGIIKGTFLIQISTKLTEGIALLATSQYHVYSFYQWGRVYNFSGVSENVINIRNATLSFDGTSLPQTPENKVTIHEQVTYTMRIPVPPIPSNLSVTLDLPRSRVTLKTWEILEVKKRIPRPLPIEETFLRQGCHQILTDACFCTTSPLKNGTFYEIYPDWLDGCREMTKRNCTGVVHEVGGDMKNQSSAVNMSCSDTNCSQCGFNSSWANCSIGNETTSLNNRSSGLDCVYENKFVKMCLESVLHSCNSNTSIAALWSHIFIRSQANHSAVQPHANETATNETAGSSDEYSSWLSCTELAEAFCERATLRECILPEAVFNETGRHSWKATCGCARYEPPPTAQQTEDLHTVCRNQNVSESPEPSNTTQDACQKEEAVNYGMASVVKTNIFSSREGVICTFIGGNRHNPFNPGVFYISEHLPANLSEGGSTILASVTMVILDLPKISRGDTLVFNATSAFSYVSYPTPPNEISRENCTCRKPLEMHFDPTALRECFCKTMHLRDVTNDKCNCTSNYVNEGDDFDGHFSCNCVNYCWGIVSYFLNPPHIAALRNFDTDMCDCSSLNSTLTSQSPTSPLRLHVEACLEPYKRNYTCQNLTAAVTRYKVPIVANCSCENGTVEGVNQIACSCDSAHIVTKLQQVFQNNVIVQHCMNKSVMLDEESLSLVFNRSDCSCLTQNTYDSTTDIDAYTTPQVVTPFTLNSPTPPSTADGTISICTCAISCDVHIQQDCVGTEDECNINAQAHLVSLPDGTCQCQKIYKHAFNISDVLEWYRTVNQTTNSGTAQNNKIGQSCFGNTNGSSGQNTSVNEISCNVTKPDAVSNIYIYDLYCDCDESGYIVSDVEPSQCVEVVAFEEYDCDCFVPLNNETQYILDNWDYNVTITDQMITRKSHEVVVVEPELQIAFTRRPDPSIVDSIDVVIFDFEITHTEESDAPAFNVTLQLDAVNFTRNSGFGYLDLPPGELSCSSDQTLCDIFYDNTTGRFHLPLLSVEPAGAIFKGTFNLSVGNHIDFVAGSLITATAITWYDSSIIDFPGRLYPSISTSDTVQIDVPTIEARLDFTTANSYMFFSNLYGDPPNTFSIGDYVRMEAKLWMPEITLQLLNFSIEAVMQNFTVGSGRVLLSERIYHRNDSDSIYVEIENDPDSEAGYLYPGKMYNSARFLDNGISVVPGVIVNEADNMADDQDFALLYFTFRVQDAPYWMQGVEIPFTISATYISDYVRKPSLLSDDRVKLMLVEPRLSLRVEILDHPWQIDQVQSSAGYTCNENTCCSSQDCSPGRACITATDNMQDCTSSECLCYSGFASNDLGTCSPVGRTAGDIINYGLTATHHVDFTGNAFDVFILVRSDLPSDLIPNAHFISHQLATNPLEAEGNPSIQQLNDREFQLYIRRFNYDQMCERFVVPHRIQPQVVMDAGRTWKTEASMWYSSAKPYNTPILLNTESRLYHIPTNITFNLTAPVPSARFCMLPPSAERSSRINFRMYSSSDWGHQVTVNLREEERVRFRLEVVVPKIKCSMTVLLALPKGDGFKFDSVRIVEMGNRIIFPREKLSNDSLTSDLDGNQFYFAELPDIYSQPYTINRQREFNSTIQRRFKAMKGEQQPHPTIPSCTSVNSTLFERPVRLGCFHDKEHFFLVAMATNSQPENWNLTTIMTQRLCHELCRDENFPISATKNGSDCYCGNHTIYHRYADIAHSLYMVLNRTVLESYTERVDFECNQTQVEYRNYSLVEVCMDRDVYEACTLEMGESCKNQTRAECVEGFAVDCQQEADFECSGSSDSECLASHSANCSIRQTRLCGMLAERQCEGEVQKTCLDKARKTYLARNIRLSSESQTCCLEAYVNFCSAARNMSCRNQSAHACTHNESLYMSYNFSYSACHDAEFYKCVQAAEAECLKEARPICLNTTGSFWNQTGLLCDRSTNTTLHNVTVANCTSLVLQNCTTCLYNNLKMCETLHGDDPDKHCSEISVDICLPRCAYKTCQYNVHENLTNPRYSNCSRLVTESFNVTYLGNCSQNVVKWHNVTTEVVDTQPVTVDYCNTTCSGDPNSTCGGEDFVMLYGSLEGALAQQQCSWHAGLYSHEEDVFSLEFELRITPLLTKGVTEILHPFVTYDHGSERTPTILPFAPYRLEAGIVQLDMSVWVSPDTEGFVPGDFLEFYTEMVHNPLSTVTARDISVVWMFPTYIEYINLTNHESSLRDYNELQPVKALRTDPAKGFQFSVPTLRNTDMISFHFLVKLDPQRALQQGEYHMVALAEAYYYSLDLYNPHENDFKHNVVTHVHGVIPTKIAFEVPTKYTGRPELEDLKLSAYTALYDEVHNIMYVCFYNNTKHVYEGGCFMTGNLPAYEVEVPPTCDEYCNCTYAWDLPAGSNCSEFEPKPENCSCGCLPDCIEEKLTCEKTCQNCTWCSYGELQVCLAECSADHTNCSQDCCLDSCTSAHDWCLIPCRNCSTESNSLVINCSYGLNCALDCSLTYGMCAAGCVKPHVTCRDNCTARRGDCQGTCEGLCQGHQDVFYPGFELNCSQICGWDCIRDEDHCKKDCCLEECGFNQTLCKENCVYSCRDDADCTSECLDACSTSLIHCSAVCDPPALPCFKTCQSNLGGCVNSCNDTCNDTCSVQVCEDTTSKPNCSEVVNSTSDQMKLSNCSFENCTTSNTTIGCSNDTIRHCYTSSDPHCLAFCSEVCYSHYEICDEKCCLLVCLEQQKICFENCSYVCDIDVDCLQDCVFNCTDLVDECSLMCVIPLTKCEPNCEVQYQGCKEECWPCGRQNPDAVSPQESTAIGDGNYTPFVNQTKNGTSCMNESGTCHKALNSTTCFNGSTTCNHSVNVTSGLPPATNASVVVNCSAEVEDCQSGCDMSLTNCKSQCPCEEFCFQEYLSCWPSCYGCEQACLEHCKSHCSAESEHCIKGCIQTVIEPIKVCTENCEKEFDMCLPNCVYNVTADNTTLRNMGVKELVNGAAAINNTCVRSCVNANNGCLGPCLDMITFQNCSEDHADFCSAQCHIYAYAYSNGTMDVTYENRYQECLLGCSNHTKNKSNATEGPSTDSSAPNTSSTPHEVCRASNVKSAFVEFVNGCLMDCENQLGDCAVKCEAWNTSVDWNQTMTCAKECGHDYKGCNLICSEELVYKNCSPLCEEANQSCLESCETCLECRSTCRQKCNNQKAACLGVCFPLNCQDILSTCLKNCSVCACTYDCRTNCSLDAQECYQSCLPGSVKSCRKYLSDCLSGCPTDTNLSLECTSNCSTSYAVCAADSSYNMTKLHNCSLEHCSELVVQESKLSRGSNFCNGSSETNMNGKSDNDTAAFCCNSSSLTCACDSLCLFSRCTALCNKSLYDCQDGCQACLHDKSCFKTCATRCVDEHYGCHASCYGASFSSNCTNACQVLEKVCTGDCKSCMHCSDCKSSCEADYINCTALSDTGVMNISTTGHEDSNMSIHPNCSAFHNCSDFCPDFGDSGCLQHCLMEFISPNCSSQDCTEYKSLCDSHGRRRRSVPQLGFVQERLSGRPLSLVEEYSLVAEEAKPENLKAYSNQDLPDSSSFTRMLGSDRAHKMIRDPGSLSGSLAADTKSIREIPDFNLLLHSTWPSLKNEAGKSASPTKMAVFMSSMTSHFKKSSRFLDRFSDRSKYEMEGEDLKNNFYKQVLHLINWKRNLDKGGNSYPEVARLHHVGKRDVDGAEEETWNSSDSQSVNRTEMENDTSSFTNESRATKWRALHSNVGNVLGIESSSNTLYALSHHGLAFLRSHDFGNSWVAVATDVWLTARNMNTFVSSKRLSDDALPEIEPKELIFASVRWNDTWGVSGVGIHLFDNVTAEWNTAGTWLCCRQLNEKFFGWRQQTCG